MLKGTVGREWIESSYKIEFSGVFKPSSPQEKKHILSIAI